MNQAVFESYLQHRFQRAGALTPGAKLEVIRTLQREAREHGRVPVSDTAVMTMPIQDPRVQAVLAGRPVTVGDVTVQTITRTRNFPQLAGFGGIGHPAEWPLWAKLVVLSLIVLLPLAFVGLFLSSRGGDSNLVATVTPSIEDTLVHTAVGGATPAPQFTPTATPTPTPTSLPLASIQPADEPLAPVSLEIAGQKFVLSEGQVDKQGLWKADKPSWLSGTLVRPIIAIPALQVPVEQLQSGNKLILRRRNGSTWRYIIESVLRLQRTQTEVMSQTKAGLVVVLLPPEEEGTRNVIVAAPMQERLNTPTPVHKSRRSNDVETSRAVVKDGPLRVRSGPGLQTPVLTTLEVGTWVYIRPQPVWSDGLVWVQVVEPIEGWVALRYLALSMPNP